VPGSKSREGSKTVGKPWLCPLRTEYICIRRSYARISEKESGRQWWGPHGTHMKTSA
ncbi:unnamed protein product, partial [Brassica oleracea]